MHFQSKILASFFSVTLLLGSLSAIPATAQQPYHVIDHWTLPDAGWWDYLIADPAAHRLYITRGDHVDVLDSTTGKSVGAISGLHGTHGVALDSAGKFG